MAGRQLLSASNEGTIAAVAAAVSSVLTLLLVAVAVLIWRCRQRRREGISSTTTSDEPMLLQRNMLTPAATHSPRDYSSSSTAAAAADTPYTAPQPQKDNMPAIQGISGQSTFITDVARHFRWLERTPLDGIAVEEGITVDTTLPVPHIDPALGVSPSNTRMSTQSSAQLSTLGNTSTESLGTLLAAAAPTSNGSLHGTTPLSSDAVTGTSASRLASAPAPMSQLAHAAQQNVCMPPLRVSDPGAAAGAGQRRSPLTRLAMGRTLRLNSKDIKKYIELMADGLIGEGSSAYVFKCRWQRCFGPRGLLVAKVLKESAHISGSLQGISAAGSGTLPSRVPSVRSSSPHYDAFHCEAAVLEKCSHPNVVRLYAYCLEPPNVCLIMELLPGSLLNRLYGNALAAPLTAAAVPPPLPPPAAPFVTITVDGASQQAAAAAAGPVPAVSPFELSLTAASRTPSGSQQNQQLLQSQPSLLQRIGSRLSRIGSLTPTRSSSGSDGVVLLRVANEQGHKQGSKPGEAVATTTAVVPPITMREALQIATDIAAALAHLHLKRVDSTRLADIQKQGGPSSYDGLATVVHRDLRPGNVLLSSHGRAKVSNFGSSTQHLSAISYSSGRAAGGHVRYRAPEVLGKGAWQQAVTKEDIYSLGILLWEIVSHEQPWKGKQDEEVKEAVLAGTRPELPPAPPTTTTAPAGRGAAAAAVAASGRTGNEPASFAAEPQLRTLIQSCWQGTAQRRPAAQAVHKMLQQMMARLPSPPPQAVVAPAAAAAAAAVQPPPMRC